MEENQARTSDFTGNIGGMRGGYVSRNLTFGPRVETKNFKDRIYTMGDDQYEYGINKASRAIINISTKVIIVALALILLYLGINYGFRFGRSLFYADPPEEAPGRDLEITITDYDTNESVAQKLYEAGAISDERSFVIQSILYDMQLFPGTYVVNTSETIRNMILSIDENADEYEVLAESEQAIQEDNNTQDEVLTGGGEGD